MVCQLQLWRWSRTGKAVRPSFRLIGAPYTSYATLLFLAAVVGLMAFSDDPLQRGAVIAMVVVVVPLMVGGWFLARKRILQIAQIRQGHTGQFPVVAERPASNRAGDPVVILEKPDDE